MRFKHATLFFFQPLFNNIFILLIFVVDQFNHSGFMMMPLLLDHLLPNPVQTTRLLGQIILVPPIALGWILHAACHHAC
jgi:hypothetical protein